MIPPTEVTSKVVGTRPVQNTSKK